VSRRVAVAVALILVVVSACTRGSTIAASTPTPTPMPTPSTIAWFDCGRGFQCGSLKVPLDYANPTNATINIALIRKPATNPSQRIGSVLTNPGGPGASGIDYLKSAAGSMKNLNVRFDLIGFDPRGVGLSSPVRCLTAAQEDTFNALDPVLDDPQEKQAGIQADQDFAAGCQQISAKILPFLDTPNTARDMDQIRAAVGDEKLTYLGFSYGTFLGETYAHLFPTHVRALSLDGVIDPTLSANDLLLAQVVSFEKNLQAFIANCKAHASCQFGRSGDPNAKLMAFMQSLDAKPMQVGNRTLTRALAVIGVLTPLYSPSEWPYLDLGLTSALGGDGRLLLALSDAYLGRQANGTYTNELDASFAINCMDRPAPTDVAAYDQLGPAFANASPLFGPATQYGNLGCAYWPVKPTGQAQALTADGAPPILLVGGTNDPATPYAWAVAVSHQITNSVLLTRQGDGHVSYDKSICAQQAEDDYLINLTLPDPGTVCTS
jgi:pimeloyl-ACP methyl ester carboxylesterase